MKYAILFVTLIIMHLVAGAQKPTYKVYRDTVDKGLIFDGQFTLGDLEKETSFTWMTSGKKSYQPDEKSIKLLQFYMWQYTLVIFLGTWCDDSHNLVPKLARVLEMIQYPMNRVTVYGVDRDKITYVGAHRKYGIANVPTFILFKDDREAGRITESVKTTVEGDLSAIITQEFDGQEPH